MSPGVRKGGWGRNGFKGYVRVYTCVYIYICVLVYPVKEC